MEGDRRNVLGCGKVWKEERGDVGEVREMWREVWGKIGRGSHIPYISPHFSHTPTHFPTSTSTPLFTPPPIFFHSYPHTFSLLPYSPILDPTPQTTKNSLLPHHPYSSKLPQILYIPYSSHTPSPPYYHCYFIIYPTLKLLTFLIYCQINPAIKCTTNS